MIVDYGPLAESTTFDFWINVFLIAAAITAAALLISLLLIDEYSGGLIPGLAALLLVVSLLGLLVLGPNQGREEDEIRDREYPVLLEQAGYTDLQRIENGVYAAIDAEGDLVVVEVEAVEDHPTKFLVLEIPR